MLQDWQSLPTHDILDTLPIDVHIYHSLCRTDACTWDTRTGQSDSEAAELHAPGHLLLLQLYVR